MLTNATPEVVLILDCETTGIDPNVHHLCEVGAVLFSVNLRAVIQQISFLIPIDENPAEAINGIPPELTASTNAARHAHQVLADMADAAGAYVAHNADFDRQWIAHCLPDKPWICTCHGITWPGARAGVSLTNLALAFGVPVWAVHRALADCTYLAQIFERDAELEAHLAEGLLPQELVAAIVSYDERELAKAAGFRWVAERKQWERKCNFRQIADLPFKTRLVNA
jgi:DNA polymerase-3 subunit epsilon